MEKLVKQRPQAESASIHIETTNEKILRLLNTDVRYLRRTGGSSSITIPAKMKDKLPFERGDRIRIFVFNSFDEVVSLHDELQILTKNTPFIVMIKDVWRE